MDKKDNKAENAVLVDLNEVDELWLRAKQPKYKLRMRNTLRQLLKNSGIREGHMLEISPGKGGLGHYFPAFTQTCLHYGGAIKKEEGHVVIVGDISQCPHIPDNSFDVIFSLQVFEHVKEPWRAAAEIKRILKPGGLTFHSAPFSWRYHPHPVDFWRFSPDALEFLFSGLKCIYKKFDIVERRRNATRLSTNDIPLDVLGGWRENIRVSYAGIKVHE